LNQLDAKKTCRETAATLENPRIAQEDKRGIGQSCNKNDSVVGRTYPDIDTEWQNWSCHRR